MKFDRRAIDWGEGQCWELRVFGWVIRLRWFKDLVG